MSNLTMKFLQLKTSVGGNREKSSFEDTFGAPMEEKARITGPNRANTRILAELEFVLHLSDARDGEFDTVLEEALDFLLEHQKNEGVLTNQVCDAAEEILMPVQPAAKEYKLILASHAHIDMNWMWGFNETVAATLATFRSILNLMDQYPEFCYSQSQASVYKIVEEYDPGMMEEIKARIAEGRWEVTATNWVETDKNMPSGESLLRHIEYTKEYMFNVWGVKRLDVDFSPDTFGHSINVPEINNFGQVKYYYHCRGNERKDALYRYRSPSGKEILVHKEPQWYNAAIIPQIGTQAIEISKRSYGLKTGLVIYGVGDHGGGPSRRDIERALEMMTWKIFPELRFGTVHEYFDEAAKIWDQLPVVTTEMNFVSPGCYTTQARIKRGNRRLEAALSDAEHMTALAGKLTGFPYAKKQMTSAWQNVLFSHFHDILTGSCKQESREYAMGQYQTSIAVANTQTQNAMRSISLNIDTSSIPVDIDAYNSQSAGAGVGYGIENFVGVPSTEQNSGRTRIYHVFNTLPYARKEITELAVWDWTGDLKRVQVKDYKGKPIPFQMVDDKQQMYWDHRYFRVLVDVEVPAMGYTTVVISEKEMEEYPVFLFNSPQTSSFFDDLILDNGIISVRISAKSGRILSLVDKRTGEEVVSDQTGAGFTYIETETATSSAWHIGRHMKDTPVERCTKLFRVQNGELRQSVKAEYEINGSTIEVTYSLDRHAAAVKIAVKVDWRDIGVGKDMIPVLDYRVPAAYKTDAYMYDVPAGILKRPALNNDVPGLQFGMALNESGTGCITLISDCKYGYRGANNSLALTLINSSTAPDPYPERGIHDINMWLGVCTAEEKKAEEMANICNHSLFSQASNCHTGSLPMESSLVKAEAENAVVSAIVPCEDGGILVRMYETAGKQGQAVLTFISEVAGAEPVDLLLDAAPNKVEADGSCVRLELEPYALAQVKVFLK